ncbi:DUF6928 family protein [Streptomyces griseomycini]|uniref:DUF6928 family protein n=1 Tax=Streptomyces griseomycini TaxID=66895 RepID=UPI003F4DFD47
MTCRGCCGACRPTARPARRAQRRRLLAFAVREDGRLVRSLGLPPGSGIIENIGEPFTFELPYWAGDRPADIIPWPGEEEESYAPPFPPPELGEDALRALCGFVQVRTGGPSRARRRRRGRRRTVRIPRARPARARSRRAGSGGAQSCGGHGSAALLPTEP